MHELSVCQGLLAEVARIAAANRAIRVMRISVAVGPLSGIEAQLLERAFTIARSGTIAADAELDTETTEIRVWCAACGVESAAAASRLLCAQCGDWHVQLRSGDQLLLKRVEIETSTDRGDVPGGLTGFEQPATAATP
ncbi:MAG: hydrogenase maturation nickel metallochaperone HypA [Devosia sp.]|nr:hydrogenase maturation nickel metallochaperone HypA [Devosia sp.]